MYIASQIFAAISLFFNIWSRFFKNQHHNLFINIFASIFNLISYILLTAYMGMVGLIVSTIRSIVFFLFAKNKWEKKTWLLVLFVGAQLGTCILTASISGFIFIDFVLVFLKGSLYTYGSWQHNNNIFRWSSIISCVFAIIYNLRYDGYMNCASEFLSIVILLYVILREYFENKKALKLQEAGVGNIENKDTNEETELTLLKTENLEENKIETENIENSENNN